MRIGVCAPGGPLSPASATAVRAAALARGGGIELVFHPQCFAVEGHFAGPDAVRADAFVDLANDPTIDAVWFARGGYGAVRIAVGAVARLDSRAGDKAYLGYSDAGCMLAALQREGVGRPAHGPMPVDITREGGEAAIRRALDWLADGSPDALDPSLSDGRPAVAFNLVVLSQIMGTPIEPLLDGRVLMLEEVGEYLYRIDRSFAHLMQQAIARRLAGLRLGRCSAIPENDRPFGRDEVAIAEDWCARAGVTFLGRADIGHDAENRVVPFR
ncbi:LD-carboxypeptidase [bacterium]|nr:LD-carboxypeptidase [bacterium]